MLLMCDGFGLNCRRLSAACDAPDAAQMRAGLAEDGGSSLPMIPTLVDILPDGHEHGKFFSIDLGGTNLRCAYIKLPRDKADVVSAANVDKY